MNGVQGLLGIKWSIAQTRIDVLEKQMSKVFFLSKSIAEQLSSIEDLTELEYFQQWIMSKANSTEKLYKEDLLWTLVHVIKSKCLRVEEILEYTEWMVQHKLNSNYLLQELLDWPYSREKVEKSNLYTYNDLLKWIHTKNKNVKMNFYFDLDDMLVGSQIDIEIIWQYAWEYHQDNETIILYDKDTLWEYIEILAHRFPKLELEKFIAYTRWRDEIIGKYWYSEQEAEI